jgi:hypothetical protein
MLIDYNLELADAVSVAAAAGSAALANTIDLGAAGIEPNCNRNLYMVITVSTTFTSSGSATVQFRVASDDSTTISTTTATQHAETGPIGYADLKKGNRIIIPLPLGYPLYERYLGLVVITATATTTAGSINAFVSTDAALWKAYADGL